MINVLADQYLFNIRSFLPSDIHLKLYDPAAGLPADLSQADALLIRTVNSINKQTLPTIPENLQFIGTGSAGTDHVDIPYLRDHSVTFANAAGCNARSVAEYIATALLLWSNKRRQNLSDVTVGIVGAGHVGSEVSKVVKALGMNPIPYDPPREERDSSFTSCSMDEVLACEILTCHTPLSRSGRYPTYHWLDDEKLQSRRFNLVLNAARGGVVDENALLVAFKDRRVGDFVLDVWEAEPHFNNTMAGKAFIKSPHIAGYSIQAKNNASRLVAEALMHHFDLAPTNLQKTPEYRIYKKGITEFDNFSHLLKELHPICKYDQAMQDIIDQFPQEKGKHFNRLRAEFPLRQEFSNIYLPSTFLDKFPMLDMLGFSARSETEKF